MQSMLRAAQAIKWQINGGAVYALMIIAYTDGASRGNPGLAGAGWILCSKDEVVVATGRRFLGSTTCNIAEYQAAIGAIQHALNLGATKLLLRADSQLLVRQLNGQYQVHSPHLKPLYQQLIALKKRLLNFDCEHIPRAQNAAADQQANQAIDLN